MSRTLALAERECTCECLDCGYCGRLGQPLTPTERLRAARLNEPASVRRFQ